MLKLHFFARAAAIAAAAGALALPSAAPAATATNNFTVTANVSSTCKVSSTTNVVFGAYDPFGSGNLNPATAGYVGITCTKGTPITSVDLDYGKYVTGGTTRRMADGAGNFITYELYKPIGINSGDACAYTNVWTSGATNGLVPAAAPSKAERQFNVCGQTALGQDVPAGSYSDTVTVTVNY